MWSGFKKSAELQQLVLVGWATFVILSGEQLGFFSKEVGAFLAGVVIPSSALKELAVDVVRPLKEFFLMIFFGSIGLLMRPLFLYDNFLVISTVLLLLTFVLFLYCLIR